MERVFIDHKNLFKPVVKEVKSRNGSSQSFLFLKVTPPLRAERIIQKELSFFFARVTAKLTWSTGAYGRCNWRVVRFSNFLT